MLRSRMAVLLLLTAFAAGTGGIDPPAALTSASDYRFTTGRSAPCIPFDPSGRQISLPARVNGHDGVRLTLDTGSQGSVLDAKLAASLDLTAVGRQRSLGAGGEQAGSTVRGVNVELPGFQLLDQTMDTLALETLSAQSGRRMDGILGHQIFARCVVQVDYAQRCVSLFDAAGYEYAGRGAVVPIELLENHPYVTASVVLPGGRSITGRFVVDTGASSNLILSSDTIEPAGVEDAMGKTLQVQGYGVGGGAEMRLARVDRLDLGGYSLARPIAVLLPDGAGRVSAPGTLGNIGGGILSRFKVIFDYGNRRMILEPGPGIAQPFESDMSGLAIVSSPPDYRAVRVARVQNGSPALDAGVQPGDEIESVDGAPAGEIGLPALRERFRQEDRVIQLGLRRGTRSISVTLRTRRLI